MAAGLWLALAISLKSGGFLWAYSLLEFCGTEQQICAMNSRKRETKRVS